MQHDPNVIASVAACQEPPLLLGQRLADKVEELLTPHPADTVLPDTSYAFEDACLVLSKLI